MDVEKSTTSGDYLQGFYLGTRAALFDSGRESITITVGSVSPFVVGCLIALFERAVGFYASLVNINAYHQPGVEAGKVAAGKLVALQANVSQLISSRAGEALALDAIMDHLNADCAPDELFKICEHLAANPGKGIKRDRTSDGQLIFSAIR